MIYSIKSSETLNKKITKQLGLSFSKTGLNKIITSGSNLYILKNLDSEINQINENARCNFEKFQNGLLLRINERQKLYSINFEQH